MKSPVAYVVDVVFNFKGGGDFKKELTLSICVLDRAGSNVEYET